MLNVFWLSGSATVREKESDVMAHELIFAKVLNERSFPGNHINHGEGESS
jgi:hypothetical protein